MTLTLYLISTILSIYGWSWILSKSTILQYARGSLASRSTPFKKTPGTNKVQINKTYKLYKFLYSLINCIVCTSFWIAILHIVITQIVNSEFSYLTSNIYGVFTFLGSSITIVWIVANLTGDAD